MNTTDRRYKCLRYQLLKRDVAGSSPYWVTIVFLKLSPVLVGSRKSIRERFRDFRTYFKIDLK